MVRETKFRKIMEMAQGIANHFKEEATKCHILQAIAVDGENIAMELMTKCGAEIETIGTHPLVERSLYLENISANKISNKMRQWDKEFVKSNNKTYIVTTKNIIDNLMADKPCTKMMCEMGVNLEKLFVLMSEEQLALASANPTPYLDKYSTDLTAEARSGKIDPVIGRKKEIDQVCHVLARRTKNNGILVGEAGVGKTAIVEGLAQKIVDGKVPEILLGKRIVTLDIAAVLAGTKYRGDFEERIKQILDDIIGSNNVILFIDEIHQIIGAGDSSKGTDAANIMKPYLSRGMLRVLGATTPKEEREIFEKDGALDRRFHRIRVEEPSEDDTEKILKGIKRRYEDYHRVDITDDAIKAAVKLSARYITKSRFPDKAIDILDHACGAIRVNPVVKTKTLIIKERKVFQLKNRIKVLVDSGNLISAADQMTNLTNLRDEIEVIKARHSVKSRRSKLSEKDIASTIGKITSIPVTELTKDDMHRLKNLEPRLKDHIIGQDEALQKITKAIQRSRVGLSQKGKPIGSFLLLGPTGVGKTETAKVLTDILFGSQKKLIRFNMSEYMEEFTVTKLLGAPPGYVGYEEGGELVNKIKDNPYSVVLFDEVEKAHKDIFDTFLQILDEGTITDSLNRNISFENCIIIMTSNIGSDKMVKRNLGMIKKSKEDLQKDMTSDIRNDLKNYFKPEFLNRIGNTVIYNKLSEEVLTGILDIQLGELNDRLQDELGLSLKVHKKAKEEIIRLVSKDENANARPMQRLIRDHIEDGITNAIVNGKGFNNGVSISFGKKGFVVKETKLI